MSMDRPLTLAMSPFTWSMTQFTPLRKVSLMLSQMLEAVSLMPFMAPSQTEAIHCIPASTASDTAWMACSIY